MQLNIPTWLTLFRVVLIPFFVLAFYLPFNWAPMVCAVIFVFAAVTDWFDGFLERRWKQTTRFGAFLDPVADKVMVAVALVLVAVFGPSIVNASLALTFVALPHYVRLTRAAVLVEVNRDYVTASRVAGAGALRQMFVNILPNCLAPLIVQASLGFSNAILDMAALGFLGMGAQPPTPEWGTMLSDVLQFAQSAWWVVTFPGVAILLTVLAFNLMGDGLRDALDPKLKQ